jgi:hypothetical protein
MSTEEHKAMARPADAPSPVALAEQLQDLLLGYLRTQLLQVAATLGLADLLADGPRAVDDLAAAGVADQVEVVGGDFFAAVPTGGDYYMLSSVLHDWGDDRATAILVQCRRAMGPGARLLLVEQVLAPGNTPSPVKSTDIMMLLTNAGGRERSLAEWEALLEVGGFALARRMAAAATPSSYEVLEAVPR